MLQTKEGKQLSVKALIWDEVRNFLLSSNPGLVPIFDKLGLGKEILFFLADYQFGANIIYDSEMYLPLCDGDSISFNDPSLPEILSEHLSYDTETTNPLGLVLSRTSEYYLPMSGSVIPFRIVKPGEFLGLAGVLDNDGNQNSSALMCNLGAGARSVFILAKIAETKSHNHIKKAYGVRCDKPDNYLDHWEIFKQIIHHVNSPWRQSILFFSNKFIDKLKKVKYATLYNQLVNTHRSHYNLWHNKILKWESEFSRVVHDTNLTDYSSYALNIANHLLLIARSAIVGFAPTVDDSQFPVGIIKEAYANDYRLIEYCPTMVQPAQFDSAGDRPVYYSINHPTLTKNNPGTFKGKTNLELLSLVEYGVIRLQEHILKHLKKSSDLYIAATNAKFEFYHYSPSGEYKNIKNSSLLLDEDPRFTYQQTGVFPAHSLFTKCCIKISPKVLVD